MKIVILLILFYSQIAFSSLLKDSRLKDSSLIQNDAELSSPPISHIILFKEGEALCVADATKYPSLVPSFLTPAHAPPSGKRFKQSSQRGELPDCGSEEMNNIHQVVQHAVLLDEENPEIQVAM